MKHVVVVLSLLVSSVVLAQVPKELPPTAKALEGRYIDTKYQEIPFGTWSVDYVPYRSWMDTRPASVVFDCFAVNFNNRPHEWAAALDVFQKLGMTSARVEYGPGNLQFDDPSKLNPWVYDNLKKQLTLFQAHGVRPMILLNSNSGAPVPLKDFRTELLEDAKKGDLTIKLKDTSGVVLHHTGFRGQAYQVAYPLITRVSDDGVCTLSGPIENPVAKGPVVLNTLRFAPFAGGPVLKDGTAVPFATDAFEMWENYVKTICVAAREILGTEGKPDAGFDLEVWNEYTFGSQFLTGEYYKPRLEFKEPFYMERDGIVRTGSEIILPITIEFVMNPANGFPGVRVIDGLANQRPWEHGAMMWPGQYTYSRHYYTGISPSARKPHARQASIDAFGKSEPAGTFAPTMRQNFPEYMLTAFQTEMMTRDLQPFPNSMAGHFRFSLNPKGQIAPLWQTEYNFYTGEWWGQLKQETKKETTDPEFIALMDKFSAMALSRSLLILSHKGLEVIQYYSSGSPLSEGFGLFRDEFLTNAEKLTTTEDRIAAAGLQMQTLLRIKDFFGPQKDLLPRPLEIGEIVEHAPVVVQKGNGQPNHPDYFARDRLAILPFQTDAGRYVIAMYVVTHDMTHPWNPDKKPLDIARYQMPPGWFDIEIKNLGGEGASIRCFDPIENATVEAAIVKGAKDSLTVRLPLRDYPVLLEVVEKTAGPVFSNVEHKGEQLSFESSVAGEAEISHGAFPERAGAPQKMAVKAGPNTVKVPALKDGEGIKLTMTSGGLTARWPLWDYDPAGAKPIVKLNKPPTTGVRYTMISQRLPITVQAGGVLVMLPPLPEDKRPAAIEGDFTVVSSLTSVFPALSVTDDVSVDVTEVQGHPAWQVKITMEPTAHPGEKDLKREWVIVPLQKGFAMKK